MTKNIGHLPEVTHNTFLLFSDSFAQRAAVRAALAKDQEWQEKYMSHMLPLLHKQKNEIAYLVPWCELGSPPKDGEQLLYGGT